MRKQKHIQNIPAKVFSDPMPRGRLRPDLAIHSYVCTQLLPSGRPRPRTVPQSTADLWFYYNERDTSCGCCKSHTDANTSSLARARPNAGCSTKTDQPISCVYVHTMMFYKHTDLDVYVDAGYSK